MLRTRNLQRAVAIIILLLAACSPVAGPRTAEPFLTTGTIVPRLATTDPVIETTSPPRPTLALSPQPTATATQPALPPEVPVPGIELESFSENQLELAGSAGAHWLRRNALDWSLVEPQEGAYNWQAVAGLEAELQRAAEAGFEVVLVVRGTPAWAQAQPGVQCGPVKTDKLPAFAEFVRVAVARFSVAPYSVRYWELGNEPDIDPRLVMPDSPFGCWGNADDSFYGGESYAEMLKQVYPQIKDTDPEAQVLVGGLLMDCDPRNPPKGKDCTSSFFLKGILRAGGGDFFDGVSFHAYDYYMDADRYSNSNWGASWDTTGPVLVAKTRYLRDLLDAQGYADKYLMNTEAGLLCRRDGSEPDCQTEEFQRTKAAYVAMTHLAAQIYGLRANIWFSLNGWRGTALVDRDGNAVPAYGAFQIAAQQLNQAAYTHPVVDYPGVRAYEFLRAGRRVQLLVSLDGEKHTIKLPAVPSVVQPAYGEPPDLSETVTVGAIPIFVEFAP